MESKPRSTGSKSGKSEKASAGSAPGAEKKESSSKEAPPPVAKKMSAASEATPVTNDSTPKHSAAETGNQEAAGPTPDSDSKENGAEGEATGSFFENVKPLILVGGVAVAAIAVILGVVFFARKK